MTSLSFEPRPAGMLRLSPARLAGVALGHAGLVAARLNAPAAPQPVALPRPLTVSLIEPEPVQEEPRPARKPAALQSVAAAASPVLVAEPAPPTPQPLAEAARPVPEPDDVPAPEPEPLSPPAAVADAAGPGPTPLPSPPTPPRPADYLANPGPANPPLSRRLGEEGTVRLNILVSPDGSVARLELAQSSGLPRLDRSAVETVQSSWKFDPARQAGKPVAA